MATISDLMNGTKTATGKISNKTTGNLEKLTGSIRIVTTGVSEKKDKEYMRIAFVVDRNNGDEPMYYNLFVNGKLKDAITAKGPDEYIGGTITVWCHVQSSDYTKEDGTTTRSRTVLFASDTEVPKGEKTITMKPNNITFDIG